MISLIYIAVGLLFSSLSSRYIFGGDSAEFSAVAHTWSIPHPPGYPLYSLLSNIFTHLIPLGTIPWRTSLLSVIPTILTSYLLYKICAKLKVRGVIAVLVSLLYVVLFPTWQYALVPEVFALNSFLVIATTYFLLCSQGPKKDRYLWAVAFFIGLNIAHHHIFVIFIPGWLILIKNHLKKIAHSKKIYFTLLLFLILGAAFYLYAPIASYFNPPIQWEDSKTFEGFWRLITRAVYGTYTAYGGSKGNFLNQIYDVLSLFILIFQDFRIIGLLCIGTGIWINRLKREKIFQFLSITSFMHIFFLFYTNFALSSPFTVAMYERFLISFYAILCIYLAIGYNYLYSSVVSHITHFSNKKSILLLTHCCLVLIFLTYVSTVAKTNFKSLSYIKNGKDFDRLGKDILDTIPVGGVFFPGNDNAHFTAMYQIFESKYKSGIIFFQMNLAYKKHYIEQFKKKNKMLLFPSRMLDQKDLERFIVLNKKRGIYLETPLPFGFWMPYGLLWKYYDTKAQGIADLTHIVQANTDLWNKVYHIPELNMSTRNILHLQSVQDFYIDSYMSYAKMLYLAHEPNKAQEVIEIILKKYQPSNNNARITLLNLLLLEKKCPASKNSIEEIVTIPLESLRSEFITPLINYYTQCDPSNKQLSLLKKKREKEKIKSLTPLDRF